MQFLLTRGVFGDYALTLVGVWHLVALPVLVVTILECCCCLLFVNVSVGFFVALVV